MAIGIGVELGPSGVRAVSVERSAQGIKLLAAREVLGELSNIDALTHALTQLRRSLPITQPVVLGIPSTSAILTTVSPLVVNPRRAHLAVQFELQQQLPFEVTQAAWHYQWLSASNGRILEKRSGFGVRSSRTSPIPQSPEPRAQNLQQVPGAIVAAMKRSLLDERLGCCRRAGLTVKATAMNPLATLNAWSAQAGSAHPTSLVLLHLVNGRTVEWIVRTPSQFQVVSVALEAAEAGEAFLGELAASWEALRSQFAEVPNTVWLVDSPEAFPRFQETIAERLRLEVQPFDLTRAIASGVDRLEHPGRWAVAFGLALQGMEMAGLPLNLLASSQSERRLRQARRVAVVTGGLCTVAALWFGVSGMAEVRQRRAHLLQSLERQERLYQSLRPDVLALLKRQQRIEGRSVQLEQLVGERVVLTHFLSKVAEALPDDVWLTKLECTKDGSLDGLLEGRAKSFQDVTQFLDRLKSVAGMTTVKPLSTNVITDQVSGKEVIAFSVQIQRQRAPAPPATEGGSEATSASSGEEASSAVKKPAGRGTGAIDAGPKTAPHRSEEKPEASMNKRVRRRP